MTAHTSGSRLALLKEGAWDAPLLTGLQTESGLPTDAVLLSVSAEDADRVADELPALVAGLPALEVAVLVGPLASETWRRQSAFHLHVTLIDAPDTAALPGAVRGAVAMLS